MTTWLNTPFAIRFRAVDGLTAQFAAGKEDSNHDAHKPRPLGY
jgi:hypothetical protein